MSFFKFLILPIVLVTLFITSMTAIVQKAQAQNGTTDFTTTGKGFAVVELFTSEGCSSCPPAERYLNDMVAFQKKHPHINLYPLAFHVDYWDYIGWKDSFAQPEFGARQKKYNIKIKRGGYTPQMYINGTEQFIGSQRQKGTPIINRFLNDENRSAPTIRFKSALPNAGKINISYATTGDLKDQHAVVIAVVETNLITKVKRGENRGKTLTHQNVVRHLQMKKAAEKGTMTLDYPAGKNLSLIGFIQDRQTFEIIAATQRDL